MPDKDLVTDVVHILPDASTVLGRNGSAIVDTMPMARWQRFGLAGVAAEPAHVVPASVDSGAQGEID